jgi:hypothetical protein
VAKKLLILSVLIAAAVLFIISRYGTNASEEARVASSSSETGVEGDRWQLKGALSEACTCNVPCTCNFGEGPSPHPYCYVVYAYEIREGHFNGVSLDGLRMGGLETAKGNALYLDARAEGGRRTALEAVARKVMRVNGDMMGSRKLLGIKYVEIKQVYDARTDMLDLGGEGSFKTNYIMGRDKTKPVTVINNTEWPVHEAIKGKTEYLLIKDSYGNRHSAKNTNSNHGDYEFDEKTRFGSHSCGAACSSGTKGGEKKHEH